MRGGSRGAHSARLLRRERGRLLGHGGHDCGDHCGAINGDELLFQHHGCIHDYSRRSGPESKENACQQQIRIHTSRLHENDERNADNHVTDHGNGAKTDAVAQKAPYRTGDEHDELVGKTQGADSISNLRLLADSVGDDEGDGGIEEDEEGDAEQTDADEVS